MKSSSTSHIRSATFSRAGNVKLPAGTWTAAGSIKLQSGELVNSLVCTLVPLSIPDNFGNTHSLLIEVTAANTAAWPIATLVADIKFTDDSIPAVVIITNRFNISVQPEV